MATILHGGAVNQVNPQTSVSPMLKIGAAIAALLFGLIAFVIPGPAARVILGVIALALAGFASMPPLPTLVRSRLLIWLCSGIAVAAFLVAVFRAFGADHIT